MILKFRSLGEAQRALPPMIAKLIVFAYEAGYELTFGDAFRDPRVHGELGVKGGYGHKNSNHKNRLAVDLNLFKDGVYLTATSGYEKLGEFWESIGGCWGGRFSDGNHFSIEWKGMK
jgi:hypothetical protein